MVDYTFVLCLILIVIAQSSCWYIHCDTPPPSTHPPHYHSIFSLTYKSIYRSTPISSNFSPSPPSRINSSTSLPPKCGPRCLRYLSIISGFASPLRDLCPSGASTTTSSSTVPSCSVTVSAFGMERVSGLW